MISFTITTFFLPGRRIDFSSSSSTMKLSSNSFITSRISWVMMSNAVCAAIGPRRSMLVFSWTTMLPLIKISPLSGHPGRPHMMFSSRYPSEEPNSPIWTPPSSVPVSIITTPSSTLVAPSPRIASPSFVAIGWTSMIVSEYVWYWSGVMISRWKSLTSSWLAITSASIPSRM